MKLSLCIPTNGIMEWICPVIESIYNQNVPKNEFEVVVVDNGSNEEFQKYMGKLIGVYNNLTYKKIKCSIFMNEIYSYKMATGNLIKFVNHRTILLDGTLEKWIEFMKRNQKRKPIIYFSNGVLDDYNKIFYYRTFDDFVKGLGYWSSWSTGMAIWKEDLDTIPREEIYNELFPHTNILLRRYTGKNEYIIDNQVYLKEIKHTSMKKGSYDLFHAFAVEYPSILLKLYQNGEIHIDTFLKVKDDNLDFITKLYLTYIKSKERCSYDVSSYKKSVEVFYSCEAVIQRIESHNKSFCKTLQKKMNRYKRTMDGIAIWGAGIVGKREVENMGEDRIVCFIDSDVSKQGALYIGIPVVSLEKFVKMRLSVKVLVCVSEIHHRGVISKLKSHGISYEIIF